MAIKKIPVPFCDCCGLPWLPRYRLADGTLNPAFTDPKLAKCCGKCKRPNWNAGGVDRRRKTVVAFAADPDDGPVVGMIEAQLDVDIPIENPRSQVLIENLPPPVTRQDVLQTIDRPQAAHGGGIVGGRCKHMLYKCPQCHPREAA